MLLKKAREFAQGFAEQLVPTRTGSLAPGSESAAEQQRKRIRFAIFFAFVASTQLYSGQFFMAALLAVMALLVLLGVVTSARKNRSG